MHQIAVFTDPKVTSTVTGNLEAKSAKGGIHCVLHSMPHAPVSDAILKNGQWEEVSTAAHSTNSGNPFSFSLRADDEATTNLLTSLRDKKTIGEMVVYELNTSGNEEQYGYYFHKVFVKSYKSVDAENGDKLWNFECTCVSFKEKDSKNNEPVIYDSDSNTPKYTGSAR